MRLDKHLATEPVSDTDLRIRWVGQKRVLIEEPPSYKLFSWFNQPFYLPMPWLYYVVGLNPERHYYGGRHHEVGRSPVMVRILTGATKALKDAESDWFSLPLPNLYGTRPCYYPQRWFDPKGPVAPQLLTAITEWWEGNSNYDAFPRNHPVYQELASRPSLLTEDEKKHRESNAQKQFNFFRQWESLSHRQLTRLPWPKIRSFKLMTRSNPSLAPARR